MQFFLGGGRGRAFIFTVSQLIVNYLSDLRRAHAEPDPGRQPGLEQYPRGRRRLLRVPRQRATQRAEHPLDTQREGFFLGAWFCTCKLVQVQVSTCIESFTLFRKFYSIEYFTR